MYVIRAVDGPVTLYVSAGGGITLGLGFGLGDGLGFADGFGLAREGEGLGAAFGEGVKGGS